MGRRTSIKSRGMGRTMVQKIKKKKPLEEDIFIKEVEKLTKKIVELEDIMANKDKALVLYKKIIALYEKRIDSNFVKEVKRELGV